MQITFPKIDTLQIRETKPFWQSLLVVLLILVLGRLDIELVRRVRRTVFRCQREAQQVVHCQRVQQDFWGWWPANIRHFTQVQQARNRALLATDLPSSRMGLELLTVEGSEPWISLPLVAINQQLEIEDLDTIAWSLNRFLASEQPDWQISYWQRGYGLTSVLVILLTNLIIWLALEAGWSFGGSMLHLEKQADGALRVVKRSLPGRQIQVLSLHEIHGAKVIRQEHWRRASHYPILMLRSAPPLVLAQHITLEQAEHITRVINQFLQVESTSNVG